MLVGDRDRAVPLEGRPAGEELIEHAAGRVEVAAGVDVLALRLLGREVLRGADHGLRLGHRRVGVGDGAGDAEVHHLDRIVRADHHVRRLDVAVDDAHPVRVGQGVQDALGDPGGLVAGQLAPLVEDLAQGLALDVLHDDEGDIVRPAVRVHALVLAGVVDRDDRGVVEAGAGLGLSAEAGEERGIAREVAAQHLDGDRTLEAQVDPPVDLGHAAAADQLTHFVPSAEQTGLLAHCRLPIIRII